MTQLPVRVRRSLLLRSLAVQGSWNYQTLIGTGFAYMLLPALRHQFGTDHEGLRAAVARHTELFNSHPYLAGIAAGAVVRLESERASPELVRRFKDAIRSPLGSIGDRLFWVAWRPMCALGGIALLLLGVPSWIAAAAFLLVYNALHLYVRYWGVAAGLTSGLQVGATLREAEFQRWADQLASGAAMLAGFTAVLAVARVEGPPTQIGALLAATVAGFLLRGWTRRLVWGVLVVGWFAGVAGFFAAFG